MFCCGCGDLDLPQPKEPLPDIFKHINQKSIVPMFTFTEFAFDNPNRPLTTQEVQVCREKQKIFAFGLIHGKLDEARAEKTIRYIHSLYPYLNSSVYFDEQS